MYSSEVRVGCFPCSFPLLASILGMQHISCLCHQACACNDVN